MYGLYVALRIQIDKNLDVGSLHIEFCRELQSKSGR